MPQIVEVNVCEPRSSERPGACVLIGDSATDMQAASLAGTDSIGYANKPGKHAHLAEAGAGAGAVVSSVAELVLSLRARPLPN